MQKKSTFSRFSAKIIDFFTYLLQIWETKQINPQDSTKKFQFD